MKLTQSQKFDKKKRNRKRKLNVCRRLLALTVMVTTRWRPTLSSECVHLGGDVCLLLCVFNGYLLCAFVRDFPWYESLCVCCLCVFLSVSSILSCVFLRACVCAAESASQHLPRCLLGHRGPHEQEHTHLRNSRQQKQTSLPICQLKKHRDKRGRRA